MTRQAKPVEIVGKDKVEQSYAASVSLIDVLRGPYSPDHGLSQASNIVSTSAAETAGSKESLIIGNDDLAYLTALDLGQRG